MANSVRINGTVEPSLQKSISKLAQSEKRSFSAMMNILLDEAVIARHYKLRLQKDKNFKG